MNELGLFTIENSLNMISH